jgi:hypothetical protein
MAKRHGNCRVEHGVANQEIRVVANPRRASDVGEEKDLEDRRQQNTGLRIHGVSQLNSAR